MKYKRIILKISGEALGCQNDIFDFEIINNLALQIKTLLKKGYEIGIVLGAGNIFRGGNGKYIDTASSHYMGMIATEMNAIAFSMVLNKNDVKTKLFSALNSQRFFISYDHLKAIDYMKKNNVVFFAGGTGNPYFTTDTAGVLRAMETDSDILIKATKVNGIYDKDPVKYKNATKYKKIKFEDVYKQKLKIMDMTAFTLAWENKVNIGIINLFEKNSIINFLEGKDIGSIIY